MISMTGLNARSAAILRGRPIAPIRSTPAIAQGLAAGLPGCGISSASTGRNAARCQRTRVKLLQAMSRHDGLRSEIYSSVRASRRVESSLFMPSQAARLTPRFAFPSCS